MELIDTIVLMIILAAISAFGLFTAMHGAKQTSVKQILHGSNVSILTAALSVCSGFLSAISLLGFPAEVYYQGAMMFWYGPMYIIAFPIAAYLFLPVLYNLKLTSIYEYLEIRFNFACRFLASLTFCIQTLLYVSVALYAPALALSAIISIPLSVSVILTAGLAAFYVFLGGAKASIATSALQMLLILVSMVVIFSVSLYRFGFGEVVKTAIAGGRLQLLDFRIDPRIRHSFWSLMIGGTGNILCLFAANQLTIQRYMAMSSLKSAQWVILLNIPFNILILMTYIGAGLIMYYKYANCNPIINSKDQLFPHFVMEQLSIIPGMVGLFAAAIYSAGLSTVSASYSALSAVFIEDIIKQFRIKVQKCEPIKPKTSIILAQYLPLVFCCVSMAFAYMCSFLDTMMLQISLSIFGSAGGPVLSVFFLGMFFPKIKHRAAFAAQLMSTIFCIFIAIGGLVSHVRPVRLPLDQTCERNNTSPIFISKPEYGMVEPLDSDSWLIQVFRLSYQYYSIVALLVGLIVAHIIQFVSGKMEEAPVDPKLLSSLFRPPRIVKIDIASKCSQKFEESGDLPMKPVH